MANSENILPEGLSSEDVSRYSRQMLVSDIGALGQSKISKTKVIVVGAGGLGSAVIATLAGAGVGMIGIIDPDIVDCSNLHRQTIHREKDSGKINKAKSAARFIHDLNSSIQVITFCEVLDHSNVQHILNQFHVVVDASDNPKTRYLLNDACIFLKLPLISGSAVGLEGQLTVYNYQNGPCYRCVYPIPPKSAASCADSGVVGMVPAVIGNLQGLEVLKIIAGFGEVLSGTLVMYDARSCSFHRFKTPKRLSCVTCGQLPTIDTIEKSEAFSNTNSLRGLTCSVEQEDNTSIPSCSAIEYNELKQRRNHILIDVRESNQFAMCSLKDAINIPLSEIKAKLEDIQHLISSSSSSEVAALGATLPIYVICRRGIASTKAAEVLISEGGFGSVINITGGLTAWSQLVDQTFPLY